MKLLHLTTENLDHFRKRISALRTDTRPKWGKLTATKMLRHLRLVAEMSLGEIPVVDKSNILTRFARVVVFHVLPVWPKNLRAPAAFTPEPEGDFVQERDACLAALQRFTQAAKAEPNRMGVHALFGPVTLEYWTFMHARHFEHHFQQFGI